MYVILKVCGYSDIRDNFHENAFVNFVFFKELYSESLISRILKTHTMDLKYTCFLEACKVLQQLIELPLRKIQINSKTNIYKRKFFQYF